MHIEYIHTDHQDAHALQETVNRQGEPIEIQIKGRHDPIIVPRAVVVVESMAALVILDALLASMTTRMDRIKSFLLDKESETRL